MNSRPAPLPRASVLAGLESTVSSPQPILFSTVLLMVALCIGVLIRSAGLSFLSECFRPVPVFEWSGLLALIAGLFGAVALHEAGHFFAALANDFEVGSVVIGPFRVARLGTSWKLILKKHRPFEASVSAFPRTTEDWQRRMMTVIAAGPVATLITGCAAALLLRASGEGNHWLTWLLRAFVQVSFFIFVLGLIPNSKSSHAQNDAALFRSLWRNGLQANEIFLYHRVLQQERSGVQPRDYSIGLIQLLADFQGSPNFMGFFATTLASWAFDSGHIEEGNAWDERALDLCVRCGPHSRSLCTVNSACFDLIYRQSSTAAIDKLNQLDLNSIVPLQLQYRARAVAYLAWGSVPEALAIISAARFMLPKRLQTSGAEYSILSQLHSKALTLSAN
ncbi:MAG: M50 family metallopeptidase [Acidobacteriaceae bacterium]|nr:M50 family metallopeptidase [Acidobacteriaceae bacterium]